MNPLDRMRQTIQNLLKQHEKTIAAAPEHFGFVVPVHYNGIDDGAQYETERQLPDFVRQDLDGWIELH